MVLALVLTTTSVSVPAATPAPVISIGLFADCQYARKKAKNGRHYELSLAKLEEAVAVFNSMSLGFSVNLGDFIQRGYKNIKHLNAVSSGLTEPLYHVLGNHDYAVKDTQKPNVFKALNMPARYYEVINGDWCFLFLDGNELSFYAYRKVVRNISR
ncbi:MAG: hypothetical protein GY815_03225 [Gammaproteobacteria bacterium]|nr:hypothetical protein [Gammaproteobacteria bacterium]